MSDNISAVIGVPLAFLFLFFFRIVFVAPFQLYRRDQKEIRKLNEKIAPRLMLTCGKHIDGCHVKTTIQNYLSRWHIDDAPTITSTTSFVSRGSYSASAKTDAIFLKLAVSANCVDAVRGCMGIIQRIEKEGVKLNNEQIRIPFYPGQADDAYSKIVRDSNTEHLDILYVTEQNKIYFPLNNDGYPASIDPDEIFAEVGDYLLCITVSGENTKASKIRLKFNWTGDWQTAELSCHEENIPVLKKSES